MGRLVLHCVCVLSLVALPVGGCSDEMAAAGGTGGSGGAGGDGGSGGDGGTGGVGGTPECESADDCDDGNECTGSACGSGMCEFAPVADGTACDEDNECSVSMCSEGICPPVADDTACGDDAGTCQQGSCRVACDEQGIRDAIAAGGGPYTFDCDGPQTVVTEAEIVIDNDVVLDGEGNLTVDGGGEHVDRGDNHRVFFVTDGMTAELHGFTVTRGVVSSSPDQRFGGGGILNEGTLTVTISTVSGNDAPDGGGIGNSGALTLTNSTVSGNESGGDVGGIGNSGTLTLTNSTVSGNAGIGIGGIWNEAGTMTVTNSTVSGNESLGFGCDSAVADGIANHGTLTLTNSTVSGNNGCGQGIVNFGTLTVTNSTLVSESEFDDRFIENRSDEMTVTGTVVVGTCFIDGNIFNSYNIESPGDTCGFDQASVTAEQLNLGPLQDNGGGTQTHALLPASVAIDVIPADMCEVSEDQRGEPRPGGTMCDVGAFEVQP